MCMMEAKREFRRVQQLEPRVLDATVELHDPAAAPAMCGTDSRPPTNTATTTEEAEPIAAGDRPPSDEGHTAEAITAIGPVDSAGDEQTECTHDIKMATSAPEDNPETRTTAAIVLASSAATAAVEPPPHVVHPRGSIEHALDEVSAYERSIETVAVVARSVVVTDTELIAGDAALTMSKRAFATFCGSVKAPNGYISQLPLPLQRSVLGHHLELSFGDGERVHLLAREGEYVGMRDPKLLALTATDVLRVAADALANVPFRVAGLRWPTPTSIEFELVMPSAATEVAVGDIVQAGVRVTHSITGGHACWISAFLVRLVCSNGLTARQCVAAGSADGKRQLGPRTRRLPAILPHARESQLDQVRRLVLREVAGLDARLEGLARLTTERTNIDALFASFVRRAHLPQSVLPVLREAWTEEGGAPTRWAAVNALTRVATHNRLLPLRILRSLAALGGLVAFEASHICPRCFHFIAGPLGAHDDDHAHEQD
jgi:hypothetical protein